MKHRLSLIAAVTVAAAASALLMSAAPARVDCSAIMALAGTTTIVTLR